MSSQFIAVEDMELEWIPENDSGDITIIGTPSTKVKADGKGVYNVTNTLQVSNVETANITAGTGVGVWTGSLANKTKNDGSPSLKENDIALVTGTGTNKTPPPPTMAFASSIRIKDAAQTKVKGV